MSIIDLLALTCVPYGLPLDGSDAWGLLFDEYLMPASDAVIRADNAGWTFYEKMVECAC